MLWVKMQDGSVGGGGQLTPLYPPQKKGIIISLIKTYNIDKAKYICIFRLDLSFYNIHFESCNVFPKCGITYITLYMIFSKIKSNCLKNYII